jgi:hypothetical protein
MSEILLETQGAPASPSAGQILVFPESIGKRFTIKDENGKTYTFGSGAIVNQSVADQTGFSSDTYLTGSSIAIPSSLTLQAGSIYKCRISLAKTAAGIAAPTYIIRIGVNGTIADTAIITFTGAAQTAAADVGYVDIFSTWRSVGASGILQATFNMIHNTGAATGLIGSISPVIELTSAAFNTTTASLIMGVSVNGGASAAYTVRQVHAELRNI